MAEKKKDPVERAREIARMRLLRHLRGLERAGLLSNEKASQLIGSVKILYAQAEGTFEPKEK